MNIHLDSRIFSLQRQGGVSRLWRSLAPALRDAMPDATFTATLPPDLFISTYYAQAPLGVRSLVMVYDAIPEKYALCPNRADRADIRRAVSEASAVVSISHTTASDVKRLYGRDSTVAYPGVDADFGKVLPSEVERFQQSVGKPYVLVVGRRGAYKNVQALYQAWPLWSQSGHHKVLAVGGEMPLPPDVAFASRYDWQQVHLSDHELALAYAGAYALVYPSIMEGFGLPLIEAMTCACPVICDTAMVEVASGAALYCDVAHPRSIALRLSELEDPGLRLNQGLFGIEMARRFTWPGMAATVADAIRRAA